MARVKAMARSVSTRWSLLPMLNHTGRPTSWGAMCVSASFSAVLSAAPPLNSVNASRSVTGEMPATALQKLEVGPDGKLVLPKVTQAELPKPRTIYRIEFSKTGKLRTLNMYGETDEFLTVREDNSVQAYSRKSKGGEVFVMEVDPSGHVQTRGIWPTTK